MKISAKHFGLAVRP